MSFPLRLPFILCATVAIHVASTPPNPPASTSEQVSHPNDANDTKIRSVTKPSVMTPVKASFWAVAFAETCVSLATHTLQHPVSRKFISNLAPYGSSFVARRMKLTPFVVGASLVSCVGGYIRYRCYHELGRHFTFELSILQNHRLITTGPYAIVRHPGYTGALMAYWGLVGCHLAPGSWLRESGILDTMLGRVVFGSLWGLVGGSVVVGLMARISKEEGALRKEFGNDYLKWEENVPYRLIPGIF